MSPHILAPNTESAILARILQADEQELTPDAARYWLSVNCLPAIRTASMSCQPMRALGRCQRPKVKNWIIIWISDFCSAPCTPRPASCSAQKRT